MRRSSLYAYINPPAAAAGSYSPAYGPYVNIDPDAQDVSPGACGDGRTVYEPRKWPNLCRSGRADIDALKAAHPAHPVRAKAMAQPFIAMDLREVWRIDTVVLHGRNQSTAKGDAGDPRRYLNVYSVGVSRIGPTTHPTTLPPQDPYSANVIDGGYNPTKLFENTQFCYGTAFTPGDAPAGVFGPDGVVTTDPLAWNVPPVLGAPIGCNKEVGRYVVVTRPIMSKDPGSGGFGEPHSYAPLYNFIELLEVEVHGYAYGGSCHSSVPEC